MGQKVCSNDRIILHGNRLHTYNICNLLLTTTLLRVLLRHYSSSCNRISYPTASIAHYQGEIPTCPACDPHGHLSCHLIRGHLLLFCLEAMASFPRNSYGLSAIADNPDLFPDF